MSGKNKFGVIIVGGSYSGLAAGMALGRALKKVLIIDDGKPCNIQTPYSHNFITNDGKTPYEITAIAKQQVQQYSTIVFLQDQAVAVAPFKAGFQLKTATEHTFLAKKIIFATGIRDLLPAIEGLDACWGITVIHCPYCHGYEVRDEDTGVLSNGEQAYEFSRLISNWTKKLTLFTNGTSTLTPEQITALTEHNIQVEEREIAGLVHTNRYLEKVVFSDGSQVPIKVLYSPAPFQQHCKIPQDLGCDLTNDGYIKVDAFQETSVNGIYACGDSTTKMRTVANAVATGTNAGMSASKKLIIEEFNLKHGTAI